MSSSKKEITIADPSESNFTANIIIAKPEDENADSNYSSLLEIVENFEDPFELVRELLSNSRDSDATNVTIEFKRLPSPDSRVIFIYEDNGEGLKKYTDKNGNKHDRLEYFFKLGKSDKRGSPNKIGNKGFGSKICLLSDAVKVSSRYIADDGTVIDKIALLEDPHKKLNNREVVETIVHNNKGCDVTPAYKTGTRIEITSFHATKEDQFTNTNLLKEYIQWFTTGGTILPLIRKPASTMKITIKDYNGDELSFTGEHNPPIDTDPTILPVTAFLMNDKKSICGSEVILRSNQFAKRVVFPTPNMTIMYDGKAVVIEVAAWILGSSKKNEFAKDGYIPDRDRFGVWLAQNGILVQRHYSWITSSPLDCNFHIVVNCDQFELNADRTRIKGKNNKLYVRVKDEFDRHFKQTILKTHKEFRDLKDKEEKEIKKLETQQTNGNRVNEISDRTAWTSPILIGLENEPETELEVCGALCVLLANNPSELSFKLLDLSPVGTDAVVSVIDDTTGISQNTMYEVEMKLSNFLKHGHSPTSAKGIICWNNDMPPKRKPKFVKGMSFSYNPNNKMLEVFIKKVSIKEIKTGIVSPNYSIPVFVLEDIYTKLEEEYNSKIATIEP